MRTLNEYLIESLLDDEEELINDETSVIESFLKDNYKIKGTYTIKNGIVDIDGDITLTNNKLEYLTNDFFSFGKVIGKFEAGGDGKINIKSLKGAPKEASIFAVNRSKITSLEGCPEIAEYCNFEYNSELLNLKGSPKSLKGSFMCYGCEKLKSLKGAPKEIGRDFDCSDCINLISLEGGPEKVGGDYTCDGCEKLKSLKGAPKKIGGSFDLSGCVEISKDDIEKEKSNISCKDIFMF